MEVTQNDCSINLFDIINFIQVYPILNVTAIYEE